MGCHVKGKFETVCVLGIRGKAGHRWVWTLADSKSAGRSRSQKNRKVRTRRKQQADTSLQSVASCWGLSSLFLCYQQFLRVISSNPTPSSRWVTMRKRKERQVSNFTITASKEAGVPVSHNSTAFVIYWFQIHTSFFSHLTLNFYCFISGAKLQISSVNPLGVYDSSTTLWLQGKGQQDQQREELQTEQSAALLAGKTEEFNRRLREQPADTQLWIKFIHYQVRRLLFLFVFFNSQKAPNSVFFLVTIFSCG